MERLTKVEENLLPPKPAPKPGRVRVVRALYKYTAQYPDELSFQEGDLLYVFDEVTDPNWWKARCGNQAGLIPSNYVESQTEEVEQPLHEAARRGNLDFMRECLQQGVSGTGLDSAGNTPLYWASHAGHVDCVRELLALPRSAVSAQNVLGDTPLHVAAARGHLEVVELLLIHGADSQLHNKDQQTPTDLAMNSAIVNLLQMSNLTHQRRSVVTYDTDEYADESD
ncbi:osteoclast-stimulating factor 1-like [Zootermopsis nevadensis]|uniref:Osteoclast-stimulating factor 1 n=1 Tax=Zootermopsis nevadensis TaxID=136037 RepID=A0A067RN24_ZOONE|nr:osteoclast-stimulating factor 1-like [Zootermopsis nevadensis]KDR22015.1 Osteoclast-stimulating factor 1 [Zootermopsis nevadensis]